MTTDQTPPATACSTPPSAHAASPGTSAGCAACSFRKPIVQRPASALPRRPRSAGEADPPPSVQSLIADIQRYLAGEPVDFSPVAVDLDGVDPFRRKLYETMRGIAWGGTTTYGELARQIGLLEPEAARDVGQAMGRIRCRWSSVPPRARRRKEARWFFRARRRRDEAEAVGVGGRAPRRRRAAAAGILTALAFAAPEKSVNFSDHAPTSPGSAPCGRAPCGPGFRASPRRIVRSDRPWSAAA